MSEERPALSISYIMAFICSLPIIILYLLAMFNIYSPPIYLDKLIPINVIRIFFYLMLILLILREILPLYHKSNYNITLPLILVSAIYSFIAALKEIPRLPIGYFIIIPPSFIYSRCNLSINCDDFASLSLSIPLTITFILFMYSLYGVFIAIVTKSSK